VSIVNASVVPDTDSNSSSLRGTACSTTRSRAKFNGATRYRKFTPEFKDEAVKMVIESSRPIADVARDIHVNEGTLGNWGVPRAREVT
jgi:hypothetical protein